MVERSIRVERDTIADSMQYDLAQLKALKSRIGLMPPQPPTLRGKLGAIVVRVVHRALFWIWPPIHAMHDALHHLLVRQAGALVEQRSLVLAFERDAGRHGEIRRSLSVLSQEQSQLQAAQDELWLDVAKLKAQIDDLRS